MRVEMAPLGDFSIMMSGLQTRFGKLYTSFFEWERSGRSDEKALGKEETKAAKALLSKGKKERAKAGIRSEGFERG
jgi:hypothetical protein